MSKEALAKVVQRAISDASFRRQLNSDPAGALRGFDLSTDEVSALRTGDAGRLSTLGVDQRMSKAFTLGGALAATRMAQSDLSAGSAAGSALDGGTGTGGRSIIPHDPEAASTARDDGGVSSRSAAINDDPDGFLAAQADADKSGAAQSVRAGDDWKFAGAARDDGGVSSRSAAINDDPDGFLAAQADAEKSGAAQSVRAGDDWKFTDRVSAQAQAAPVEGSPEADAATQSASGGMANYPAHGGLAGPSGVESARAGDDWARAGTAQMDDSARIGTARLDDASGASSGARAINDDPDGFLAANANADVTGGSAGQETAFIDESEGYLTKVGYDSNASGSVVSDAHDRGGDNVDPASIADDDAGASGNADSEGGPIPQ